MRDLILFSFLLWERPKTAKTTAILKRSMSCFLLLLCCFCCCAVVVCFAAVTQQKKNLSSHFRLDANFFFNVNFLFLDFRSSILSSSSSILFFLPWQNNSLDGKAACWVRSRTKPEENAGDETFPSWVLHSMLYWVQLGLNGKKLGSFSLVKVMPSLTMSFFARPPLSPLSSLSFSSSFSIRERGRMFFFYGAQIPHIKQENGRKWHH